MNLQRQTELAVAEDTSEMSPCLIYDKTINREGNLVLVCYFVWSLTSDQLLLHSPQITTITTSTLTNVLSRYRTKPDYNMFKSKSIIHRKPRLLLKNRALFCANILVYCIITVSRQTYSLKNQEQLLWHNQTIYRERNITERRFN